MKQQNGFTIIELMVTVAILGVMVSIAIPSFSEWTVRMRVDNEISSLHRLILTARNTSVNMGLPVTMCPLNGNTCVGGDWNDEVSVFIDVDNGGDFDAGTDTIIRVKDAIKTGDTLSYSLNRLIYRPTGKATSFSTFYYCPANEPSKNRGIKVSQFGRAYASTDNDNDGIDEFRTGEVPSC